MGIIIVGVSRERNDPKVFHLISLTPRMLRLYRFISFTIWAHLPFSYMVRTFHVPSLNRDFGKSNFICAVHFIPCLAPRCIGLMGIVPSLSASKGASSELAIVSVSVTSKIQHAVASLRAFTRAPLATIGVAQDPRRGHGVGLLDPLTFESVDQILMRGDSNQS